MTGGLASKEPAATLLVDWSDRGTLEVRGPDRLRWLDAILTCDVGRLGVGTGNFGLLLNRQGKILTDVSVVAAADRALVAVARGTAPALRESLDRMLVMEDAEILDASAVHAWISAHGPRAGKVVSAAATRVPGAAAAEIDWLGVGGGALVVPRGEVGLALEALRSADEGVLVARGDDFARLRLEHAWPEFGVDYGPDDNPHQAALDHRAVCWTKGCYVGQEVVCMTDQRGKVRRRLALVVLEGRDAPRVGAEVCLAEDGTWIGEVTTSAVSEVYGRGLALARVLRTAVDASAAVTIAGLSGRLATAI